MARTGRRLISRGRVRAAPRDDRTEKTRRVLEKVRRDYSTRLAALRQQLHVCTTTTRRCDEHSVLVQQETGYSIDDPVLAVFASRAVPVMADAHERFQAWLMELVTAFDAEAERFEGLAKRAPREVNSPFTRDGLVAFMRQHAAFSRHAAAGWRHAHAMSAIGPSASALDNLVGAAQRVHTWVRQQAPACRKPRPITVMILTHHGWSIKGGSVADQVKTVWEAIRRRDAKAAAKRPDAPPSPQT
jgi:hypothetical protein